MNKMDLYHAFGAVDDDILERSESVNTKTFRFRWQHALIAAIMCICLMGAGVVAVIWGDSIQNWFGHYWQAITGQEMSSGQAALIDHLSQEIGISQTIDDVMVTVDSATVADDGFYLLFRIEGMPFTGRKNYGFNETKLQISPDPTKENGGMASYGYDSHGIDGDGSIILIMEYNFVTKIGYVEDTRPLEVEITLRDLVESPQTEWEKTLQEGEWTYSFTIDRSNPPAAITLPDATVDAIDLTNRDEYTTVPVLITDLEVTNTGLRFKYDYQEGNYDVPAHIDAILANGVSIGVGSGSGHPLEESGLLFCSYKWLVPIDLEEVTAINFNGIIIPIS